MTTQRITILFALFATLAAGCADRDAGWSNTGAVTGRPYFEVQEDAAGDHYFNLHAANHQVILTSESYSSRTAALNGVLSVLDNGTRWSSYEQRVARDGSHYFVLTATNGNVIGMSEMYSTRSNASRGLEAVVRNVDTYLDWQANRTGERFDVFRGQDGRFYFNVVAGNGEIVLSSQGYTTEASAYNGAVSVSTWGVDPDAYEVADSADGGAYFNLKAPNGQVIGTSEVYSTRSNARRGRDAVVELLGGLDVL